MLSDQSVSAEQAEREYRRGVADGVAMAAVWREQLLSAEIRRDWLARLNAWALHEPIVPSRKLPPAPRRANAIKLDELIAAGEPR